MDFPIHLRFLTLYIVILIFCLCNARPKGETKLEDRRIAESSREKHKSLGQQSDLSERSHGDSSHNEDNNNNNNIEHSKPNLSAGSDEDKTKQNRGRIPDDVVTNEEVVKAMEYLSTFTMPSHQLVHSSEIPGFIKKFQVKHFHK